MKKLIVLLALFSFSAYGTHYRINGGGLVESLDDQSPTETLPTAQQARTKVVDDNRKRLEANKKRFIVNITKLISEAITIGDMKVLVLVPEEMRPSFAKFSRELSELGYTVKILYTGRGSRNEHYGFVVDPGEQLYRISW
jgi:hypothetical protein